MRSDHVEMVHCTLESRPGAATFYLRGVLSSAGALEVLARCRELPTGVRELVVDCRGVGLFDPSAMDALSMVLEAWREVRGGRTRLVAPAAGRPHPLPVLALVERSRELTGSSMFLPQRWAPRAS